MYFCKGACDSAGKRFYLVTGLVRGFHHGIVQSEDGSAAEFQTTAEGQTPVGGQRVADLQNALSADGCHACQRALTSQCGTGADCDSTRPRVLAIDDERALPYQRRALVLVGSCQSPEARTSLHNIHCTRVAAA